MVYTRDLKSLSFGYAGSTPALGTNLNKWRLVMLITNRVVSLQKTFKTKPGNIYLHETDGLYMCCQTDCNVYKMISLRSGNRREDEHVSELQHDEWTDVTNKYILDLIL